jgi:hypothetical protein
MCCRLYRPRRAGKMTCAELSALDPANLTDAQAEAVTRD